MDGWSMDFHRRGGLLVMLIRSRDQLFQKWIVRGFEGLDVRIERGRSLFIDLDWMLARCSGTCGGIIQGYSRKLSTPGYGLKLNTETRSLQVVSAQLEFPNLLRIRDLFSLTDSRKNLLRIQDLFETCRFRTHEFEEEIIIGASNTCDVFERFVFK